MSWHRLEPADRSLFASAPQVYRFPVVLAAPPARVWESLTSDASLAAWPMGPGLSFRVRWTAPRPFGVGTTREVRLPLGLLSLQERFFRWDEGAGYSFFAEQANRPGLRRFAEDYALTPAGTGTLLTWTVAVEASTRTSRVLGPAALFSRVALGRTAAAARRYFEDDRSL